MRYLSLFDGIGAVHVAWRPLGWQCVATAEIELFPAAVVERHWGFPNLGDVTKITDEQIAALGPIDVVVGGSPCQDLSVAGKRAGLAGARSSLFHHQARIFDAARAHCGARWLLWENVPGAFSTHGGRDFAVVVGAMAGCEVTAPRDGWQSEGVVLGAKGLVEWAVLDAQWFGVAQRRRRVFVVLDAGNWTDRPPVLLEPDSMRGHSAPRREAGEGIAGSITRRIDRGGVNSEGSDGHLIPAPHAAVSPAIKARDHKGASSDGDGDGDGAILVPMIAHSLRADGFDASEDGTGRGTPIVPVAIQAGALRKNPASGPDGVGAQESIAYTLEARAEVQAVAFGWQNSAAQGASASDRHTPTLDKSKVPAVAFTQNQRDEVRTMDIAGALESDPGAKQQTYAHVGMQVRRLTPRECERLQGFPDDYTLVTHRGKPAADGPRYKALGNSMAVPCMAWIGRAIMAAHGAEDAAREMEGDAR